MARIKVSKIPESKADSAIVQLSKLCYYYPQYTLKQARMLPYKEVTLLLRTAHKQQAHWFFNMTQIVAAPNTKSGVDSLTRFYKREMG